MSDEELDKAIAILRQHGISLDVIEPLKAERDTLRKALESIQWGSCDGCGNMSHCPECRAYRLNHDSEGWATLAGAHKPECSIGLALARR